MHPRSVFNSEPDFKQLAEEFESFKKYVKIGTNNRGYIDFKDPQAVDFPIDTLCPAVPNRLNYILWLEDLLDDTLSKEEKKCIKGIDIGVGASCIYPLLGCITNPSWSFLGTEINERSIQYANENIKRNNLETRITIKHNPNANKIFLPSLLEDDVKNYAFCMCNPPFYSSQEEIELGLLNKEIEPSSICTGSNNEMITEGGEFGFVKSMILESVILKKKIRWYTSMIGLKRTIRPLIRVLEDQQIYNYAVTSFTQGKTVRWAIAWSFYLERPISAYTIESWNPVYQFQIKLPKDINHIFEGIKHILDDLEIKYDKIEQDSTKTIILHCNAEKNTWSRAARRQKAKKQKLSHYQEEEKEKATNSPFFIFKLIISASSQQTESNFQIVWIEGGHKAQFEGFWSHLKKRIEEHCGIHKGTSFSSK
ncbi:uncharacterized protein BX663DRAFT_431029 [Cokeromyces recurvatus]|uniref:uncharacterized protein n=1 Tax=Cokeromyces recurvatus TaxID=90255 RepID=UPI00221EE3A0|nr:uncharacterized protein BX663DRAFT_431029 [Cokeromyces recurvatus]KAI7904854.1 hypothetical protein BX663DRAFT_431029 [Cokeromyces recurvatus]